MIFNTVKLGYNNQGYNEQKNVVFFSPNEFYDFYGYNEQFLSVPESSL